jgi:hypothetical protein
MHGVPVPAPLGVAALKTLLGRGVVLGDLEQADPDLHRGLSWLLANSVEGLGLTFRYTLELGDGRTIDVGLGRRGLGRAVTEENKAEFVSRFAEAQLTRKARARMQAMEEGFRSIVPASARDCVNTDDLYKVEPLPPDFS